jgi:hypothetical protein
MSNNFPRHELHKCSKIVGNKGLNDICGIYKKNGGKGVNIPTVFPLKINIC